jgi:hypothetical protein
MALLRAPLDFCFKSISPGLQYSKYDNVENNPLLVAWIALMDRWSSTFRGNRNENLRVLPLHRAKVLDYDFLFIHMKIKSSKKPFQCVLVLKDDFLGFVELIPISVADHFVVADALVQ